MKLAGVLVLLALFSGCGAMDKNDAQKTIRDVKAEHESQLMAMPGVVSVGLGQDSHGNPVIIIGIEKEEFSRTLSLPPELLAYPVMFQVVGTIEAY